MRKGVVVAIIAVLVIAGVAIGLATKNDNNPAPTNTNTSNNSGSNNTDNQGNNTPTSTSQVSIANMAFSPAGITIKKGTAVTWTNNDSLTHDVQETDGKSGPNSGNLAPGGTYKFTFNESGTFNYHCSIHPSMTGTVTVTE
jgi:plastocyanin